MSPMSNDPTPGGEEVPMPRMRLRVVCALALVASLSACVSPEELRRQDEAACVSYGFKPATDAFAACLQRESLARRYAEPVWPGAPPMGWCEPGWYPVPR